MDIRQDVIDAFHVQFSEAPSLLVRAPGRVNLIGEHTDYNDGFVLPAAINYSTWIAVSARTDRELHVIAKDFGDQKVVINLDAPMQQSPDASWADYVCVTR